jgi:iron(III) transport system substrate-binding protein
MTRRVEVAMGRLLALVSIVTAVLVQGATQVAAQDKSAWDTLVAAAQREGRVVVLGPPDPQVRKMLPAAFKARYGIAVEYLGGRGSEPVAKLRTERSAGQYTVDAAISGIESMAVTYYQEKMLVPLRPELIMPEVVDESKWKKGALWFSDPDQQYVLRLTNSVSAMVYINTDHVKPDDLRSARDLLDPKWQGKISVEDPTVNGSGSVRAAELYVALGDGFVKQIYVDQKPAISRDKRQITDWLLRGTYPISLNADNDQVEAARQEGMPVMALGGLSGMQRSAGAAFGLLALFDHAPHPAAAKLFANWMASKEGSEIWSRANLTAPTRNDIDEASFLPADIIPRPGETYLDTSGWTFATTTKQDVRVLVKKLLDR